MRHLGSLLAGILIAPVAWLLIALGQQKSLATLASWQQSGGFDTADLLLPAAYLLAAGLLIGLIATLRISPLGALVAGLFYAGIYAALLFSNPLRVRNAVPEKLTVLGRAIAPRTPLDNGTLLLVGIALLVAVFSFTRWRRWPAAVPVAVPEAEAAPAGPPSTPADLPPEPSEERAVAAWPPGSPNPWTPTPARHAAEGERLVDATTYTSASSQFSQAPTPPTPQYSPPQQVPSSPPATPPTPPSGAPSAPPDTEWPGAQPPWAEQPGDEDPDAVARGSAPAPDVERPATPPTSPWSAPPPRSGQG